MNSINWDYVSPYFKPHEILSPDTINHPHLADLSALKKLNALRELAGYPCFVNHQGLNLRGVVSSREAIRRGGALLTTHVQGKAFDVSCYDISIDKLTQLAREVGFTFVKEYRSWIHCDTRDGYIIT
jgi:hypothetical protein